jgi:hypothetical protein
MPPARTTSLAFDARNNELVAAGSRLQDTTWLPLLSPGAADYKVTADMARGTIVFTSPTQDTWERFGENWIEHASPMPIALSATPVYAPSRGEMLLFGTVSSSLVLLHHRYESAVPYETCEPGVDADRDGRAGCDDPDCWWKCTPTCPPYATCP